MIASVTPREWPKGRVVGLQRDLPVRSLGDGDPQQIAYARQEPLGPAAASEEVETEVEEDRGVECAPERHLAGHLGNNNNNNNDDNTCDK